eukprot:1385089-Rhodomonas_salina.1
MPSPVLTDRAHAAAYAHARRCPVLTALSSYKNKNGYSPLGYAKANGHLKCAEIMTQSSFSVRCPANARAFAPQAGAICCLICSVGYSP